MKEYTKFIITTIPFIPDLVSGVLWEENIKGIEEKETHLFVFAESTEPDIQNNLRKILIGLRTQNLIESFELTEEKFENKNWNDEWEKRFDIIKVTDRIVIRPAFKNYDPLENEIVITIIPKMSFGTGEHETTRLVLKLLDKFVQKGDHALDVGSGTGILAITTVKLGAASAIGIDNDEWCLLNGNENVGLNSLAQQIEIRLCEIQDIHESEFDLITANITKNILLEISEEISGRIKQSGTLILSGLLLEDVEQVVPQYKKFGFTLIEKEQLNEWAALALRKE